MSLGLSTPTFHTLCTWKPVTPFHTDRFTCDTYLIRVFAIIGAGLDMDAKMSVLPSQENEICSLAIAPIGCVVVGCSRGEWMTRTVPLFLCTFITRAHSNFLHGVKEKVGKHMRVRCISVKLQKLTFRPSVHT